MQPDRKEEEKQEEPQPDVLPHAIVHARSEPQLDQISILMQDYRLDPNWSKETCMRVS